MTPFDEAREIREIPLSRVLATHIVKELVSLIKHEATAEEGADPLEHKCWNDLQNFVGLFEGELDNDVFIYNLVDQVAIYEDKTYRAGNEDSWRTWARVRRKVYGLVRRYLGC